MHARMTKVHGADAEAAIRTIRDTVAPKVREMDGFAGLITLVDREAGTVMSFTLWESEDALRATEAAANSLRSGALQEMGVTGEPTVKTFEVAAAEVTAPVIA